MNKTTRTSVIAAALLGASAASAALPVDGAYFHVDASDASTLTTTEVNGTNYVTRWNDASGGSVYASSTDSARRPFLDTVNGMTVVSFGNFYYGNSGTGRNDGWLKWSSRDTSIREVFMVYSDVDGPVKTFLLGDGSTYHFHRNDDGGLFSQNWSAAQVRNGLIEVDGESVSSSYVLPAGLHIIHLQTTGNVSADQFARDRGGQYANGGQMLGEVIIYNKTLSNDEAASVYAYLYSKWFMSDDMLAISSSPEEIGLPSPAYGVTNGLAAGASFTVSCGTMPAANAAGTAQYSCTGWKLYDKDDSLVDSGATTSFTYTHPSPAEYRKLEWQWGVSSVKGTIAAGSGGSVSPSGEAWYAVDTPVTVMATPGAGKSFVRWTGTLPAGISDSSASVTFTPSASFEMTAVFGGAFHVATTGDDVNGDGSQGNPFATIATAITEAEAAIMGGDTAATIHVADGEYTLSAALTLAAPIVIVGNTAAPEHVVINNNSAQHLAFSITDSSAAIRGVKITGTGGSANRNGGHISMGAGLIEDCVIANGGAGVATFKGGNVYMTGGRLRRCRIIDGKSTYNQWSGLGGNIYATGGVVENCLIKGGDGGRGSGIHADGAVNVVNCTFVGQKHTVSAGGEAVYLNNANARVVNCVIYDNGGTAQYEWGNKNAENFYNCAFAASAEYGGAASTVLNLTDEAFKNYANGDYHPATGSALVDAGRDPSSYASGCATDLDGLARPSGNAWDIGCYEFDWSAVSVDVTFSGSAVKALIGEAVTFTPQVFGSDGPFTFKWNFDDGAGDEISSAATMTHAFTTAGIHYPAVSVSTDGGSTWAATFTASVPVQTAPEVLWVDASNASPAYPYATEATAATNLSDALNVLTNVAGTIAMDGVTIKVADGEYTLSSVITLARSLAIVGNTADPEQVVINNDSAQHLAFIITDASAAIKGIKITGTGGSAGRNGGHISMGAGLIEDCVIANGGGRFGNFKGGNVYMTGGRLRRCRIIDGKSTYNQWSGLGGNIYATGGVVENCLIKGGDGGRGSGIHADGAVNVINCTFVGQRHTVSAGGEAVYLNNANARIVNCVIYDNGGTAQYEWGNANANCFTYCAFAASAAYSGTASTVTDLTDADFKDYANGDYSPKSGRALVNAGTRWNDYLAYGALSATDLAGKARLNGKFLDIGCYENPVQPATVVTVR